MLPLRIDEQEIRALFAGVPSRRALLSLVVDAQPDRSSSVNVWRNHAIEHIEGLMKPYQAFHGVRIDFRKSAFDDTLSIFDWLPADLEVLWIDLGRYTGAATADVESLIDLRIRTLRQLTNAPIVIIHCSDYPLHLNWTKLSYDYSGLLIVDLCDVAKNDGFKLFDERLVGLAGSRLSSVAQVLIARHFACQWIPAAMRKRIKAIAIDLDNTLHRGVLGEDGPAGVEVTAAHLNLQCLLKKCAQDGIFIALTSKNNVEDVEELFRERSDYPLRLADFSVVQVSWSTKDQAIRFIAEKLNIGLDAILFVDDNPGELLHVSNHFPEVRVIRALDDATFTASQISHFPGVWQWTAGADDFLRIADVRMSEVRKASMVNAGMNSGPAPEFKTVVTVSCDRIEDKRRIAEMSAKTNQFNLGNKRYNEVEIADFIKSDKFIVISVRLRDRFSDSGLIGAIILCKEGKTLIVQELCVSCRALGRGLEDTLIIPAIIGVQGYSELESVGFEILRSARNEPAFTWLGSLNGSFDSGVERFELDAHTFANCRQISGAVTIVCN